jgi:hypothetical protein
VMWCWYYLPTIFVYFQAYYYFAIIEDLILRFAWAISYALQDSGYVTAHFVTSVIAPLEVFR